MSWDDEDWEAPLAAPAVPAAVAPLANKWADEDKEDDDVLDSWDAEPEKPKPKAKPKPKKEKKSVVEDWEDETLDDPVAERERLRRREIESDMAHASDLFGLEEVGALSLDGTADVQPIIVKETSKYDSTTIESAAKAKEFALWLAKDLEDKHKGEENYHEFVKALITELTKNYDVVDLRSLAGQFTAKAHEKNQQQKPKKKKAPKKKVNYDDEASYDMVDDEFSFLS